MSGTLFPDRLAALLAPGLPGAVAERLLLSPRLGPRARQWALRDADGTAASLPDEDRGLALATSHRVRQAAVLAGAVWHADRVRGLVMARDLQAFIEAYGPEARSAALQHAALAPAGVDADLPLLDAVLADGRKCLAAWLDALPEAASAMVRLRLPLDAEQPPEDAHRAHGPAILRAVAAAALALPDSSEA